MICDDCVLKTWWQSEPEQNQEWLDEDKFLRDLKLRRVFTVEELW